MANNEIKADVALETFGKGLLEGLEASGKNVLAQAKDLAQSEKDEILLATVTVATINSAIHITGTTVTEADMADLKAAKAILSRYESVTALIAKDFSEDFLKDFATVAAKTGKVFLSTFVGSMGIPLPV